MLVLSRKLGEKIVIGQDIVLTVIEVTGNRVRLGITAPDDVPIFREELRGSFQNEKRGARAHNKQGLPAGALC
jgi:carbon storage regulator